MGYEKFIFGFGRPQQQVDMHARSKKHFHFLIISIYFLSYLFNDKIICSMIHFSKPLLCVTLICGDWSDWKQLFFNAPKTAPSGKKMYLHFHSDQCVNQVFPGLHMQQVGGQYANFSY